MIVFCNLMNKENLNFKNFKKDKINLTILKALSEDGRSSYSEIARTLGLSQVAIKNRIEELVKNKTIQIRAEFNFTEFNLKLGLILLEIEYDNYDYIVNVYRNCPRVIYYFSLMGQYNLAVLFYGEDQNTFETILNSCMLYNLTGIRKSNLLMIGNINEPLFFPLKFNKLNSESEDSPCGICCKKCKRFEDRLCLGCPASKYYHGPFKANISQ